MVTEIANIGKCKKAEIYSYLYLHNQMLSDSKLLVSIVSWCVSIKRILSVPEKTKLMKEGNKSNTFIICPCSFLFLKCCTEWRESYKFKCTLIESGTPHPTAWRWAKKPIFCVTSVPSQTSLSVSLIKALLSVDVHTGFLFLLISPALLHTYLLS